MNNKINNQEKINIIEKQFIEHSIKINIDQNIDNTEITNENELIEDSDFIVSKQLPVFFNKVMALNRTISALLIKSYFDSYEKLRFADILASSGIRSLRLIKEFLIDSNKDYYILMNDLNPKAINKIKETIDLNFTDDERIIIMSKINITKQDANLALLNEKSFDYIDIDPFGSPNIFLDSAVKRIKHNGVIAITATDTSALCGTYTNACRRKYDSIPLRNHLMHEMGLRILIRKAQIIGMQYDKALIPILSISTHHYMRIFLKVIKSKEKCNELLKKHKFIDIDGNPIDCEKNEKQNYGKLWTGLIYDKELIDKILNLIKKNEEYINDSELNKLITTISNEYDYLGFFDTHELARKYNCETKSIDKIISSLVKQGFIASKTHIRPTGIKTNAQLDIVLKTIDEIN